MPYCEKCGEEIGEDDKFCPSCGAIVNKDYARTIRPASRSDGGGEICFSVQEPRSSIIGFVSFGLFLIIVGVVFSLNQTVFNEFIYWIRFMAERGNIVRPPSTLISSATLFFALTGCSNFLTAGLRIVTDGVWKRGFSDILSGVGTLSLAYFIYLYGIRSITWFMAIGLEVIVIGVLIVVYILIIQKPKF